MRRYPFKKIDAFTGPGSSGNPAATVFVPEPMPEADMLRIARELKGFVSEVVFWRPLASAGPPGFVLRYYSSECEVEFCGHGTIACLYDLIRGTPALAGSPEIRIRTRKGELTVYNRLASAGAVYITAPPAVHTDAALPAAAAAEALGVPAGWIDPRYPIGRINAGLETLIVPLDSLRHIVSMLPPMEPLKRFCLAHGIDIVSVFTSEVGDRARIARTRVFAPKYGYLEDPATGSGNAAVGYYLLKNRLWQGGPAAVEQGPSLESPNLVRLDTVPGGAGGRRVVFGGAATVRIEGEYLLA
jgi:PhzF family phenazine biosynthesis protein